MAAKLLTLLISAFLLLSLLSNNINVNAAETKTGVEDDLGLDHLNDKANEALADPIDEQESKNVSDKTVDEKDDVEVENKNKDEEETAKELSANEGDGVGEESDQAVNKEDVDNSQDKRGKKGGGRRRRRNNLRNRGTNPGTAEASLQELPVSENEQEEEEDIEIEPTTENIEDSQTATKTVIQKSKTNKRGSKGSKNQKKRGTAFKKPNAAKLKARPARRQQAKSAKRSTKKFMSNGKQFPKNNKGKAASSKSQRQKGRGGRRSKFGKRN
ncbi:high mobility group nucleosome-binding domain-containing protein 5 [Bactrocera oleae]|uniref:high mobility group nucleosome-binding domain-containing protein 5 n=1 Tax=Bactrocera oleae TaxID=104688 RepID=UPI0006B70C30|nr:uncharacterized protein LOC106622899 [Bactrocera oleae]